MVIKSHSFYQNAIILIFIGIIALILSYFNLLYWRCPFTVIFHIKCAGCGITRGVHSLLEGNIIRSLQYNPLSLLITLAFSIFCLLLMIDLACKKTLLFKTYTTLNNYIEKHRGPFIVMAILYWCVIMIYRN
ncbi:MAG: DUF2752 domain-containing protein [Bacteroides sp.]|nr:DUF2752 domain-containing protein [Bacteroides sp.]